MIQKCILAMAVISALGLTACAKPGERTLFEGKYYPAKVKKGATREEFVVSVRRVDQGIKGAREAGRFEATRYCIETVGDSTIEWLQGPDAEDGRLITEGGNLVLSGTCVKW